MKMVNVVKMKKKMKKKRLVMNVMVQVVKMKLLKKWIEKGP